jgi:hypothetical protein
MQLKEYTRIAKKDVGATDLFTHARGRRKVQVIHATDIRVRAWQLAFRGTSRAGR